MTKYHMHIEYMIFKGIISRDVTVQFENNTKAVHGSVELVFS